MERLPQAWQWTDTGGWKERKESQRMRYAVAERQVGQGTQPKAYKIGLECSSDCKKHSR